MFSPEQKRAVIRRLRDAHNLHIVTHQDPDQDGAVGALMILKKSGFNLYENRIHWHFVPPGQLLDPDSYKSFHGRDVVVHIDTGGRLDLDNLIFDHHYVDCEFHSASEIIFELLFVGEGFNPPKYLKRLVEFVNRIDSGHEVGDLEEEVYETIGTLNEMLYEEHGPVGRFVPNLPGPTWFMTLVKNKPSGTPDLLHMVCLVNALQCYAQEARNYYERETTFAQAVEPTIEVQEVGGLRIAFVPAHPFAPSDLRDIMNDRRHSDVDIMVAENTGRPELRGRFTVAILSRKTKYVAGMEKLAQALRQAEPQADVFYHQKGFLIYFREPTGTRLNLTLSDLRRLVATNLTRHLTPLGQGELNLTPTEARIA